MKKIKRLLKIMDENKKIQRTVFCIAMFFLFGTYFFCMKIVERKNDEQKMSKQNIVGDENFYATVEHIKTDDKGIMISGWAMHKSLKIERLYLILRAEEEEKRYLLEKREQSGISEYFLLNQDNDVYGFELYIEKEAIREDLCYEIVLFTCYEENIEGMTNKKKISLSKYLYEGNIYTYCPKEFQHPCLEEYAEIIQNGVVRAYDRDKQQWVYQVQNKLYFITSATWVNDDEYAKLAIPVMPSTSVVELLPDIRKQHGYDHLGVFPLGDLYTNSEGDSFYVQEVDLSVNYPITYIITGLYDNSEEKWLLQYIIPMFDWRVYSK